MAVLKGAYTSQSKNMADEDGDRPDRNTSEPTTTSRSPVHRPHMFSMGWVYSCRSSGTAPTPWDDSRRLAGQRLVWAVITGHALLQPGGTNKPPMASQSG
jgi:hypothetical protein